MSGGANAITQAPVQQGALNCATRINQVSNFLGFGPQAGAVLMMPPSQPDQRLIPLAMEVPTEGGSAYVSATFAPNQLRSNMKESRPRSSTRWAVGARRLVETVIGQLCERFEIERNRARDPGISSRVFIARSRPIRCASCLTVNSAGLACTVMAWFLFESCTSREFMNDWGRLNTSYPSIRRRLILLVLACVMPAAAMSFGLIFYYYKREIAQVQASTVESIRLDGTPVLSAFNRSPISNWSVVTGMPRAELAGRLQNSLLLLLAVTVLLLAASLSLAWFYAKRITRTIHGLRDQALALGRGEKSAPARVYFREAVQLGLAFEQSAEQLSQVNVLLVQRNLDLQQFVFVASHDLRSPLRSVKGYLTLLSKRYAGALDIKGYELIQRATSAVEHMDQLTEDLLSYARLDSPAELSSEVDCNQVVANTLTFLRASIDETGAQIDVQALPIVSGDCGQMIQLFQNLLGNALKYCKDRSPKIQLSVQRGTAEWVFLVSDNGIGIESQHLQRIFEIFKRLHTAQEYPGNGIGLAICQRIVALHGGQIWVCSEPGKGSTFFFSIPDEKVVTT